MSEELIQSSQSLRPLRIVLILLLVVALGVLLFVVFGKTLPSGNNEVPTASQTAVPKVPTPTTGGSPKVPEVSTPSLNAGGTQPEVADPASVKPYVSVERSPDVPPLVSPENAPKGSTPVPAGPLDPSSKLVAPPAPSAPVSAP